MPQRLYPSSASTIEGLVSCEFPEIARLPVGDIYNTLQKSSSALSRGIVMLFV